MLDKKVHHEEYSTFKKVFLYEIRIGWLLLGHLGREKEYVTIIISLTTPKGKCFYQTNRQHFHSNAMEDNFKSPPSWGQILRSRPLHASLGGVISLKQAKMVILKRKKTYILLLQV